MTQKEQPKCCVDIVLPPELLGRAAAAAIKENPMNLTHASGVRPQVTHGVAPAHMALFAGRRWTPGRVLKCRFMMPTTPRVANMVIQMAKEWEQYANITFDFGDDWPADIRIGFMQGQGSWSMYGTDAITAPQNQITMNLGWFNDSTPDEEFRRTTVHEFGHALGCIHEHSSPGGNIIWNKPVVYDYYWRSQGWQPQQVDEQVFMKYSADMTNFTQLDPLSIMMYPIPPGFANITVGWNTDLSETDKQMIAYMYPRGGQSLSPMKMNSPVEAALESAGDEHRYEFNVQDDGTYEINAKGLKGANLSLIDLSSRAPHVVAHHQVQEEKFETMLTAGKYIVRVQHINPEKSKKYELSAKKK
jgi:serralysin